MAGPRNNSKITDIPAEDVLAVEQRLGLKPAPVKNVIEERSDGTVVETIMDMAGVAAATQASFIGVPFVEQIEKREDGTVVVTNVTDPSKLEKAE